MTDLRRMSVFRDVQVAMDFQQMASLGYIDTEFTVYGVAYWQDDQRQYVVSSNEGEIWRFIEESPRLGRYPTPMASLTKVCPVPMGQKEDMNQRVKLQLAAKLQEDYPAEFFRAFAQMAAVEGNDTAWPLMQGVVQEAVDQFSTASLSLASDLLLLALESKVLRLTSYQLLSQRLQRARENLLDEAQAKDILQKSFYTILYETAAGQGKQLTNARREWVQRKRAQLEGEGRLVSPIYSRTYWYNNQQTLDEIKERHLQICAQVLDDAYLDQIRAIAACAGPFAPGAFADECARLETQYGQLPGAMLQVYGRRWHALV